MAETKAEEELYAARTKIRLDHANELFSIEMMDSEEFERWSRVRLNRMMVDYLLRQGYHESAHKLAQEYRIKVSIF